MVYYLDLLRVKEKKERVLQKHKEVYSNLCKEREYLESQKRILQSDINSIILSRTEKQNHQQLQIENSIAKFNLVKKEFIEKIKSCKSELEKEKKLKLEAFDNHQAKLLQEFQERLIRQSQEDAELAKTFAPFECPICLEECPLDDRFTVEPCKHIYCRNCIREHVHNAIEEMKIPIKCAGCTEEPISYLDDQQLFMILTPEEHDRYHKQSLRLHVGTTGLLTCPQPDCEGVVEMVPPFNHFVCPSCHFQMCTSCKVPWHAGQSCENYQKWKEENEAGDKRMEEMERLGQFKRCPKCTNGVVKSQGCNHMTCRCGTHFCFVCGVDIGASNPYAHFNSSRNCKVFDR